MSKKRTSSSVVRIITDGWSKSNEDACELSAENGHCSDQGTFCSKKVMEKTRRKTDFGRPWSWIIMITCMATTMIASGQLQSANIYYLIFLGEFQQSNSFTAWISAAQTAARCMAGPVSSLLLANLGARLTIIVGSILMMSSFLAIFFANSVPYLIVVYACIGASESLLSGGNLMAINSYFPKRAAFVTGLMLAGGGLGTMVIGLEIEWAVEAFGWRGAMLIQAGIALQLCVFGACVFGTSEQKRVASPTKLINIAIVNCQVGEKLVDEGRTEKNLTESKSMTDPPSLNRTSLKSLSLDPFFWLSVMSFVSLQASFSTMLTIFKGFVVSVGLESSFATVLTTVAVGNTVGRVFSGPLSGLLNAPVYMATAALACSVASALYLLTTVHWALAVVGGAYGFFQGQLFVSWLLCMSWVYGQDEMPVVRGHVMFFGAISSSIFPPLAGYTVDITGSYNIALIMISVANVCLGICGLVTYYIHHRKREPLRDFISSPGARKEPVGDEVDHCTHL